MEATAQSAGTVGRNHIIERPRLTRLLDETTARVIMLVAPAGYGKTTLARQWLSTRKHAWYQAGLASGDVAAIALGLAEAAAPLVSGAGSRLRQWLASTNDPEDVGAIVELLSEDLREWPADAWLAIDDYQSIPAGSPEEIIARLFPRSSRRLILTTRRRPTWSSARAVLYGDHFEVSQSSLAMSPDEAAAVLTENKRRNTPGIVALANGWPAVIGLAALMPDSERRGATIPDALHHFLAQELVASFSPAVQRQLCRLALAPRVTTTLTKKSGVDEQTLDEALAAGILTTTTEGSLVMHPILRAFFIENFQLIVKEDTDSSVGTVTSSLIEDRHWDDAFALIERFDRADLLESLLSSALTSLSREGRMSTLRRWVDCARCMGTSSPYTDLAEAEVAFRSAEYARARVLAEDAASHMKQKDPLFSPAHFRAGQTQYFLDDAETALIHFRAARRTAKNRDDERNAIWGEFLASYESDDTALPQLLEEFMSTGAPDRDTQVRAACGRLMMAIRLGGITEAIASVSPICTIAHQAADPLIRSSFWRGFGATLAVHADYDAGLEAIACALRESEQSQLQFAVLHALVTRALLHIGRRDFARARQDLAEVGKACRNTSDPYLEGNAEMLRCRLLLCEGAPDEAAATTRPSLSTRHTLPRQSEFSATRAMALACDGCTREAKATLAAIGPVRHSVDLALLVRWAAIVASLAAGENDGDEIRHAFRETVETGAYDPFVLAYRLRPELLSAIATEDFLRQDLTDVLKRAGDTTHARSCGLTVTDMSIIERGFEVLTPRERDVFDLLARACSNRDIARQLFITEGTAKTHVRNVLRKLGVHNRTEAALLASRAADRVGDP